MRKTTRLLLACPGFLCLALTSSSAWADAQVEQLLIQTGESLGSPKGLWQLSDLRVQALTFAHGGGILAAATHDGTICLWDIATARPVRCLSGLAEKPATVLAFSGHDVWLAAGYGSGQVDLWRTDGVVASLPCQLGPLPAQPALGRAITELLFAEPGQDAELIAVGARNGATRRCAVGREALEGHGTTSPALPQTLNALEGLPGSLYEHSAADARGQLLAVAKDRMVGIWELNSGTRKWIQQTLSSRVLSLALSRDGRWMAVGKFDGSVSIWPAAGGAERRIERPKGGAVRGVEFSPDGSQLAVFGSVPRVELWELASGTHKADLVREAPIDAVAFSDDGTRLAAASSDVGITVWNIYSGSIAQVLSGNASRVAAVAYGPLGDLLATASDDGYVRLFRHHAEPGPMWSFQCALGPLSQAVWALAFQPKGGNVLLVGTDSPSPLFVRSDDCAQLGGPAASAELSAAGPKSLAYSPDGSLLAMGTQAGELVVLNAMDSKLSRRWKAHGDEVRALAFVPPEGKYLASAALDATVTLWDVATGQQLHTIETLPAAARSLATSSDGKLLAIAVGKEVQLWDLASKQRIGVLPHDHAISAVRFSPDGGLLAATTDVGKVLIFDVVSRALRSQIEAGIENQPSLTLDFRPAGDQLAVAYLGRIGVYKPGDATVLGQLYLGRESWAFWAPEGNSGTLFRHDKGTLLWNKTAGGLVSPLLPPRPAIAPQLTVEVSQGAVTRGLSGQLSAKITNAAGAGPAYWLGLTAIDLPGGHDLENHVVLHMPPRVQRLDAGGSLNLPIQVWPKRHDWFPPHELRICLIAIHAHGSTTDCTGPGSSIVTIPVGPWWWRNAPWILLGMLGTGIGIAGYLIHRARQRALSHPAVRAVLAGQDPFADISYRQLPHIADALRRAARFAGTNGIDRLALDRAGLSAASIARAIEATQSSASCARSLTRSLWSTPQQEPSLRYQSQELAVYAVSIPPLSIHVPSNSVLVLASPSVAAHKALVLCEPEAIGTPGLAVLIDSSPPAQISQESTRKLEKRHPSTIFLCLTEENLTRILLAPDELEARALLRRVIIEQSDIRQIVPYLDAGNEIPAGESSFFFGRNAELERMLKHRARNFLVVGPRTMGKSSLLNALLWKLKHRYPSVMVLKHQLYNGSLQSLPTMDLSLRTDSPQAFYESVIERNKHPQIFLLDEADMFIAAESKQGYPFCNVMRALSGEGRASFVLVGYKDLYEATQIPDHPLRNFGEVLRLEPLDRASAAKMILEPLAALEVLLADERAVVDWLLAQTGCRPHLLAILCWNIVKLWHTSRPSQITLEQITSEVMSASVLHPIFGRWDGSPIHPLDRPLVRQALLLAGPSQEELFASLAASGVILPPGELEKSLSRLYAWHYALVSDPTGRLVCPVALFRTWLSEPDRNFVPGRHWSSPEGRLRAELEGDLAELRSQLANDSSLAAATVPEATRQDSTDVKSAEVAWTEFRV